MTRRNSVTWEADESMSAIRAGQGLLVGLLRCGLLWAANFMCGIGGAPELTRALSMQRRL